MRREAWLLQRLRYETQSWCAQQGTDSDLPLTAHRRPVNGDPEVWNDG